MTGAMLAHRLLTDGSSRPGKGAGQCPPNTGDVDNRPDRHANTEEKRFRFAASRVGLIVLADRLAGSLVAGE